MNHTSLAERLQEQIDQWAKDIVNLERMISNEKINSSDYLFFSGQHAALLQVSLVISEVLDESTKTITNSDGPRKEQDL
jgi:hypothetical protein